MSPSRKRVRRPPPRVLSDEERFALYGIRPATWWQSCIKLVWYFIRRASWTVSRNVWRMTGSHWLFLKASHGNPQGEVQAIRYIRKHTTIPVPRVWGPFSWFGTTFIVMTRVPGHSFDAYEWNRMPRDAQDSIIYQLRDSISQLRALPPPSSPSICSVHGGPVFDSRIELRPVGPFADEDEMNWYVRQGMSMERLQERSPICYESHSRRHPLVLTHADLAPRNIMIEGSTVTGIIDWEMCGWYPAHWEYLKAHRGCYDPTPGGWNDRIREFVPPFDFELKADQTIAPEGPCVGFPEGTQLRYRSVVVDVKDGLGALLEKEWEVR
ncbi:hypothetical protein PLICRDRAFT_57262 [Plicaturopsis crispa FD-325 SS-3]|uniref:Unplaced genomic scaffold PLICRscaffold_16, whole genome shotgun sequence n=1 Tax=Plicaturopsis crispa FD-325 SS-3 TaxID=944288 RepID=A0A0C9SL23_PLICR|nr:hypothetical protein PLICRDRAFT_57262 [Plicaturopsis crispa FD-325 SS-3]